MGGFSPTQQLVSCSVLGADSCVSPDPGLGKSLVVCPGKRIFKQAGVISEAERRGRSEDGLAVPVQVQPGRKGKVGRGAARLTQRQACSLPGRCRLRRHPASRRGLLTHILLLLSEASRNVLYHTEIWLRSASWLGAGSDA